MGICRIKVNIAHSINWNYLCSILCHCRVEFDQARCRRNQGYDVIDDIIDNDIAYDRIEDPELEPLFRYIPQQPVVTMAASAK